MYNNMLKKIVAFRFTFILHKNTFNLKTKKNKVLKQIYSFEASFFPTYGKIANKYK